MQTCVKVPEYPGLGLVRTASQLPWLLLIIYRIWQ